MKVKLYCDKEFDVDLAKVVDVLNLISENVKFEYGNNPVSFKGLIKESTYDKLPEAIIEESHEFFSILIFTNTKYSNNSFYESDSTITIVSFSDWKKYTKISKANGVVYLTAAVLCQDMKIGKPHEKSIGCINDDYVADKNDIELGMRSASLCYSCNKSFLKRKKKHIEERALADIISLLDLVSSYSRRKVDILAYKKTKSVKEEQNAFDVFLCHNYSDKSIIREIANELKKMGFKVWFDEAELHGGAEWIEELEKALGAVKSAAVFVGDNNIGPWQKMEIYVLLKEFVVRRCGVIPVLLRNCTTQPELPKFLGLMNWIDMRKEESDPYERLKVAINKYLDSY